MISINKRCIPKQAPGIYRIEIIFALLITVCPAFSLGQTVSVKENPAIQAARASKSTATTSAHS